MSTISKRPTVRMPSAKEDKAITAAARSDPDAQPLTPTQLKAMVPLKSLRSRPKSENKNSGFGALQPRGAGLFQVHGRWLAVAYGQCVAPICGQPFEGVKG